MAYGKCLTNTKYKRRKYYATFTEGPNGTRFAQLNDGTLYYTRPNKAGKPSGWRKLADAPSTRTARPVRGDDLWEILKMQKPRASSTA